MLNLVSAIYYHPESYPPTLNAVGELSRIFDQITIVHRPHLKGNWKYPSNVKAVASGQLMRVHEQERSSKFRKGSMFLRFVYDLWKACKAEKPQVILIYDAHALFAYSLIRRWLKPHKLWYHNHDVSEKHRENKYSIGWFACDAEKKIFKEIDVFTLPSEDRLVFFPMDEFRGKHFIVPNYPSKTFYGNFRNAYKEPGKVKVIFQGRIGEHHGIEEMLPLLGKEVGARTFELVLKGHCSEAYKHRIESVLNDEQHKHLEFVGYTPYADVPRAASVCHFGNAIFGKQDTMNNTLGTASNKIYEYAALGLPVLYLAGSPVERTMSKFEWAIPVKLDANDIYKKIAEAIGKYDTISGAAIRDFETCLNYEVAFAPVMQYMGQAVQYNKSKL
jgi:glycosyltransferase involved in cell wall biosynthesis